MRMLKKSIPVLHRNNSTLVQYVKSVSEVTYSMFSVQLPIACFNSEILKKTTYYIVGCFFSLVEIRISSSGFRLACNSFVKFPFR